MISDAHDKMVEIIITKIDMEAQSRFLAKSNFKIVSSGLLTVANLYKTKLKAIFLAK